MLELKLRHRKHNLSLIGDARPLILNEDESPSFCMVLLKKHEELRDQFAGDSYRRRAVKGGIGIWGGG